jgi:YfiR/HmsC-like
MQACFYDRSNVRGFVKSRLGNRGTWSLQRLWVGGAVVALSGLLFSVAGWSLEQPKPSEFQVETAYLYNFGKFVRWPDRVNADRREAFTICVFGQDPFGSILDASVAGRSIDGKGVIAKRISALREVLNCQILFISSSEEGRLDKILNDLDKAAILTVSDMPQFSERGGMIHFLREGNRVRFDINLTATQNAGLTLSSELLKVAATVKRNRAARG